MNHDVEMKLQAWLDGELPPDEAARFLLRAQGDPQAQPLLAELNAVKAALSHNELERAVPSSREFYWSQIQRQIQRQEARNAPAPSFLASLLAHWRRLIAPVAGAALGAAILIVSAKQTVSTPAFTETTDTSSEFDALTYHDQSSGMTVVWLKYREDQPSAPEAEPDISSVP